MWNFGSLLVVFPGLNRGRCFC